MGGLSRTAGPTTRHLYLWTTNKYVESAYAIARAWGFRPSSLLVWCKKPRGVGLGGIFKLTAEFVLFCRRGNLEPIRNIPTTWYVWPRGKHSRKPDEFYEMVESVTRSRTAPRPVCARGRDRIGSVGETKCRQRHRASLAH